MKDYIVAENQVLLGNNGITEIAAQTIQNTRDIALLSNEMHKNRDSLQKVMENFIDPSTYKHFLILNGQKLEADVAYVQVYGLAKKSLLIVDIFSKAESSVYACIDIAEAQKKAWRSHATTSMLKC